MATPSIRSATARATRAVAAAVLLCGSASAASAADLVEPWAPGFSDLELGVAHEAGARHGAALVGFGVGSHVSLGLSVNGGAGDAPAGHLLAMWSQRLGEATDLDLWCSARLSATRAAGREPACGVEWSRAGHRLVPYARLSAVRGAGSVTTTTLLGAMLPVAALQVHVELSADHGDAAGSPPLRLAVGPNWAVHPRLELLPEIAWTRDAHGHRDVGFALGVVVDPSFR